MSTTASRPPTRFDARRARTRGALVAAAQELLAEGRLEVSIQEITERANVGFGSFYNHFPDKAALWAAAVEDALSLHARLVAAATDGMADPAEVFCVGLRLTGRLQRRFPLLARLMLHSGLRDADAEELVRYVRRDLEAASAAGRFDVADLDVGLAIARGAVLGLMGLLDADPDRDAEATADELTERTLLALGLPRDDAHALVRRPLPELSSES